MNFGGGGKNDYIIFLKCQGICLETATATSWDYLTGASLYHLISEGAHFLSRSSVWWIPKVLTKTNAKILLSVPKAFANPLNLKKKKKKVVGGTTTENHLLEIKNWKPKRLISSSFLIRPTVMNSKVWTSEPTFCSKARNEEENSPTVLKVTLLIYSFL